MSNPDAIKRLRQKAGVPLPELKKTKESAIGALSPADAHALFGNKFDVKNVDRQGTPIIKDGKVNSTLVGHYATSTGQSESDALKSIQDDISKSNIQPAAIAEKIKVGVKGKVKGLILGHGDSETTGAIESLVKQNSSDGLRTAITDTVNSDLLKKITKKSDKIHIDKDAAKKALEKNLLSKKSDAVATISGYVQEGLINNITGGPVAGGGTRLDFPTLDNKPRERLKILWGS